MSAQYGDGVAYHGSMTAEHGLYVVMGVHESGRLMIGSPDTHDVLDNVRQESVDVLLPYAALGAAVDDETGGPS